MSPKGYPTKPRKKALYQEVADILRNKIYDYELSPGEWVDEPELALYLKISRTPLRESLKLLEAEGLVQIRPGQGCFVTFVDFFSLRHFIPS